VDTGKHIQAIKTIPELKVDFRDKWDDPIYKFGGVLLSYETIIIIYLFDKENQVCLPIDVDKLQYYHKLGLED
jgi:hypothetical protein